MNPLGTNGTPFHLAISKSREVTGVWHLFHFDQSGGAP
jgi:hypothetical protein